MLEPFFTATRTVTNLTTGIEGLRFLCRASFLHSVTCVHTTTGSREGPVSCIRKQRIGQRLVDGVASRIREFIKKDSTAGR